MLNKHVYKQNASKIQEWLHHAALLKTQQSNTSFQQIQAYDSDSSQCSLIHITVWVFQIETLQTLISVTDVPDRTHAKDN